MTADLAVIVAFIQARLAEDRSKAERLLLATRIPEKTPDFYACGGPCAQDYWKHFHPLRMLRDVEAKRAILHRCAARMNEPDNYPNGLVSPRALLARHNLMDLATAWSDHPDYKEGWKP